MKPLRDLVFIIPDKKMILSTGGIIIPDSVTDKPGRGTVMFAGPGLKDDSMSLEKGDRVTFPKNAGVETEYEGETYLIMHEAEILTVESQSEEDNKFLKQPQHEVLS